MPGIIAGALVAHPPILLPAVGGRESQRVERTAAALRRLDAELAGLPAALIVMISPHSPWNYGEIPVRRGATLRGDLSRFRAPGVAVETRIDWQAAEALVHAATGAGFPLTWTDEPDLDHGLVVPLASLERLRTGRLFVFLGIAGWPLDRFVEFGGWLQGHLAAHSAILIASGDLSHRLTPGAPAGFRAEGRVFDDLVIDALRTQEWERIENMDPDFVDDAGECGLRPLAVLLGAARGAGLRSHVLSYEGPFGVGYPVVHFAAPAASVVQELGRRAIDHYLRHHELIEPPHPIPPQLSPPSAVFVTLRKNGELRGCVGSLQPTEPSAAHEIIRYAVASAVNDPRFPPVRLDEVAELSVKAQLLDPPERVSSAKELDPVQFGLIVRSGDRQGLLLPGIDQIETAEEQIISACQKAGIGPYAPLQMFRFRTREVE